MNKNTFDALYKQYKRAVWKVVGRYFSLPCDKEDAFQDVFVRIWKKYPAKGFSHPKEEMAWIMKVAVTTSINVFKAKKNKERLFELFSKVRPLENKIDYDDSYYILEPLSADQRMILVLKEIEGYRYEEIADMMGIKVGTVKSRLNRAKRDARNYLEKRGT